MSKRFALLLGALYLASCAVAPPPNPPLDRCLNLYRELDRTVAEQGTTPYSPRRITGFPYLRVDRFLAQFRNQALDPAEEKAWLARLAEQDRASRSIELSSLPTVATDRLSTRYAPDGPLSQALADCSQNLRDYDLSHPRRLALIRQRAVVPDDYLTLNQILGVYPLTALPVSQGVARWHGEAHRMFDTPLKALPVQGRLQRFQPPENTGREPIATPWAGDALGIPQLSARQIDDLYQRYAPVWEIDVTGAFDLPGAPRWQADGVPTVESRVPIVYRYLSYTQWQGHVLPQLNYLVWFAERPRTGPWDILGGPLDGLIWRVTLNTQGQPLLYDSIHACGCYHQLFPTLGLSLRPAALRLPEPPLLPQYAPPLRPGERLVIRLQSGTHYIQRVYAAPTDGRAYTWRDYRELYAIPAARQPARSLFGPTGLVPGTERRERFLLWPMGIPSPGAMRERGHHATAFVGRRHFDDANLLELFFEPYTPQAKAAPPTRTTPYR